MKSGVSLPAEYKRVNNEVTETKTGYTLDAYYTVSHPVSR